MAVTLACRNRMPMVALADTCVMSHHCHSCFVVGTFQISRLSRFPEHDPEGLRVPPLPQGCGCVTGAGGETTSIISS